MNSGVVPILMFSPAEHCGQPGRSDVAHQGPREAAAGDGHQPSAGRGI